MANAEPNNESKIPLKKIQSASSIKIGYFEKFIADLVLLLDKSGRPYHRKSIEIPQGRDLIFWEGPRVSNLAPLEVQKNSESYLFYADLVNIIGQTVEWYFDNGNDRTKELLRPVLPIARDEKILQNLYGIDHILDDSVIAQSFQVRVLPIINRLFIGASASSENGIEGVDDSEYLLEQKKKAEEAEREEEKKLAEALADATSQAKQTTATAQVGQAGQQEPDAEISTDTRPIPTDKDTDQPIRGLKIADLKKIETEVAWISSPLVYSLFGRHGIPQDVIDANPGLRQELYEHVRQAYLKSGSKSRTEVYSWARTSLPWSFLNKLETFYQEYSQTLPPEKQAIFLDSVQKSEGLLKSYAPIPANINELFDQDVASILGTDSPAISKNIKNAVEALIINYGVPLQIVTEDGTGATHFKVVEGQEKNALHFIEKLPDDYLKLIFGIHPNQKLTKEQIDKLRAIALGYAQQRAMELALITHSEKVARGLLESDQAILEQLAKPRAPVANPRNLAVAMPGFIESRNDVNEKGADTVAKAIHNNTRDQAMRQLRLWNQLDEKRRLYIIQYIGLDLEKVTDINSPPERLRLFNVAEVMLKADEAMDERERALKEKLVYDEKLHEFAIAQQELIEEEILRVLYRDKIRELIGEQEWKNLEQYYSAIIAYQRENEIVDNYTQFLDLEDLAPQEILDYYEENIGSGDSDPWGQGAEETPPEVAGDRRAVRQSRASGRGRGRLRGRKKPTESVRKRLGNKLGKKGAVKKLNKKLENYLTKVAALGGPWGKAAGFALKHRKTVGAIAGLLAGALIGGLIKVFTGGVGGLLGGIGGGVIGGVIGSFFGPVGTVIGATIGAGIGGGVGWKIGSSGGAKGIFGSGSGISAPKIPGIDPATSTAQPALSAGASTAGTTTASAGNLISSATTAITALPIGVLAPLGVMSAVAMYSFYVLLIIMGAFLVPLPIGYDFENLSDLPPGLNACWPTTGYITQIAEAGHTGTHRVDGLVQAIDIWCYGADCPKPGDGDWPPEVYSSHNGVASIPPQNGYGIHVIVKSPEGYETIYGHLSDIAPGLNNGDSVGRGQLLGYMGNTGYCYSYDSQGNKVFGLAQCTHLHYEYSGGLISTIVPPGEYANGNYVIENCSTGGVPSPDSQGYLAIGPLTSNNVIASTPNDVDNPITTCSWQGSRGLEVAVNANFFNENMKPVGFAGEGGIVQYYEDSETSEAFMDQLTTLIDNSGNFTTVRGKNHNPANWDMAVSGIYSSGASTDVSLRPRTAIGMGTVNNKCSDEYAGQNVLFLAVMPSASFDQIEKKLRDCGATTIIHMDGGDSSAFCSNSHTHPSSRSVPVNIGMREAEVRELASDNPIPSGVPEPQ